MNALILGGGSKWGLEFTKLLLSKGYNCYLVTNSELDLPNVTSFKVNWHGDISIEQVNSIAEQLPDLDLVLVNHKGVGEPNDRQFSLDLGYTEQDLQAWNRTFWIDCQMPFYLIKQLGNKISAQTKVGWMVTGFIIDGAENQNWALGGYGSKKLTNLSLMRGFSKRHPGIFFAINPGVLKPDNSVEYAGKIFNVIDSLDHSKSGGAYDVEGNLWW